MASRTVTVILAIAPNSRGFGYALFANPQKLLDWGIKEVRFDKNVRCAALALTLMTRVQPSALVIEDWSSERCRRSLRVRALLNELSRIASVEGITVYTYSRTHVRDAFGRAGKSKDAIASTIAESVPGLLPWLPRKRRIWESEKHSMAIFEAAALAVTHYAALRTPAEPEGE